MIVVKLEDDSEEGREVSMYVSGRGPPTHPPKKFARAAAQVDEDLTRI